MEKTHDETKYEIKKELIVGNLVLVHVMFPDCPYPNKYMLFENEIWELMKKRKSISPHFNIGKPSPIIRFEPTPRGWAIGIAIMKSLEWANKK